MSLLYPINAIVCKRYIKSVLEEDIIFGTLTQRTQRNTHNTLVADMTRNTSRIIQRGTHLLNSKPDRGRNRILRSPSAFHQTTGQSGSQDDHQCYPSYDPRPFCRGKTKRNTTKTEKAKHMLCSEAYNTVRGFPRSTCPR